MEGKLDLRLAGQMLSLLPQRAVFWAERKTLLIADPHLGKDDTFRRAGIPVPVAVAEHDLRRLSALIQALCPSRLVILGDFLHARPEPGDAMHRLLDTWRDRHRSLDVLLVRGNHDHHAGDPVASLGFKVMNEPHDDGPFVYRHHPLKPDAMTDADRPVLAGHLHPGVTVRLDRHQARRVPCFHATAQQFVLPAFGRFTGTARVHPGSPGELYAVAPSRVIRLPKPVLA